MTTLRIRLAVAGLLAVLLGGCSMDVEPLDLRSVARAWSPNDALACPVGRCSAEADLEVPVYALTSEVLAALIHGIATAEPRTEQVAESVALDQRIYVQRSETLGLPDIIRVQLVSLPEGASAILYSRARYGFWDIGVNRKRLRRWLATLEAAARPES